MCALFVGLLPVECKGCLVTVVDSVLAGMKRQRLNTTWFNIKRQRIHWDIEWRFACAKVEIMDKRYLDVTKSTALHFLEDVLPGIQFVPQSCC